MINFITNKIPLSYQQVALLVMIQGNIDKLSQHQLEKQLQDYLQVGFHFLILDCSSLKAINSTGLQILLKTVEMFHEVGGVFLFIKVLPQISNFFDKLGFTPIFTSFTRQEEAIAYLEEQIRKSVEASNPNKQANKQSANASITPQPHIQPPQQTQQQMLPPTTSIDISRRRAVSSPGTSKLSTSPSSLEILLEIQAYQKMQPFKLFPMTLTIMSIKGQKDPPILNVIPYFPGCTVVPEYRAIYLAAGQQTCFWITPFLSQNIPAWLELWCGEENIQQLLISTKVISSQKALWIWGASFSSFIFLLILPTLTKYSGQDIPTFFSKLQNFLSTIYPWGYLLPLFLAILAIFCTLSCRQSSPGVIQQKFEFEG